MSNVTMKSNSLYIYKRTCPLNKMRGYWSFIMKQILFNGIHVFSNIYKLSRLGFDLRNCYEIYLSRIPQTIAHKITYRAIKNQGMIRKGKQFLLYMWLLLQIIDLRLLSNTSVLYVLSFDVRLLSNTSVLYCLPFD
jgi:hypothetical protein